MARAQILVAARDLGFAKGLAADLESLGYAITEVVSSPEEALKKAQEKQPDLVLLDLGLIRNGKKKASQDLRKRIPNLVYLVGEEDPQTLERAKITHSFDYLRKAYDPRELETIIDMALYRRQWQQREEKQTAKIGKITAKFKSETGRHQLLGSAVQAERNKLFAVLDTLPAYVALLAPDYTVPYANREFEKRFGAAEGRKCYEFLFGRTSPCPDCETYKVLQTNAPHEWEWSGPDGRDYQIYDFPFPDTDGTTMILEMGVDVTVLKEKEAQIQKMAAALRRSYEELEARVQDRTQELSQSNAKLQNEVAERLWSEKKLKESEERYRNLVALSPDAIAVYSQGELVFINPAGVQLFGAHHYQELVGKPGLDLIHPEHRDVVQQRLRRLTAEGGRTKLREIKILRLDGRAVDVEAAGVGITYQGQPAVQVVLRDITARKQAEQKLEHQASFPRLNPNPVLEADLSGNITYANAASLHALEKLGLENRTRAFLPPDLNEIMKAAAERGKTLFYREVEIGGAVYAETISFPKEFEVIRIYARDITQQKRAEMERQDSLEKLQASEEELQVINEELQVQAEELRAQTEELLVANQEMLTAHAALRESREDLNRAQAVAHTGSWRLDVWKNELLWSDETYRIFGISQGTPLTYEAFLATIHPQDREYVAGEWAVALGGRPYDLEHRIVVGGTVKWVRERAELEFDLQGQLLGGFGTVQDITERKLSEEALSREKNISETTIESLPGIFYLFDSQGRFLKWNKNFERVSGYNSKELSRMSPLDFFAGEDKQLIEQRVQEVFTKGEATAEAKFTSKNGQETPYFFTGVLTNIDNTNCLIGMGIDIAARKEAEETLQASRDFLEIANRHTHMAPLLKDYAEAVKEHTGCDAVAIRILDEEGRIPYQAHAGFSPEFIACESPLSIHTDQCLCINVIKGVTDPDLPCYTEGSSCYINRFSHVLDTAPPRQLGETRNVCHKFGYESLALIPIVFGGQILGLIHLADCRENMVPRSLVERLERIGLQLGTAINRVRAEEERQRLIGEVETERARLQAVIESAPEAIVVVDAEGRLLLTNPAADRLYSHPDGCVQDAPSCALFQFCHADGSTCIPGDQPLLRSAQEGEVHRNLEMVLAWPDGRRRDVLVNTAPIMDQQKRSSGAVGLFQDITQRKRGEEKIRKLNLELSDRIREVSERTLQLEAANKELEAFSYSVSHDLRTPLRAIEGFARMLTEDHAPELDEEGLRLLDVIRSNTHIMGDLIDDLLSLSRLGRQEIRAQKLDLEGLVTSAFEELQAQEPARQMELILKPLPPAYGDRTLINQVLVNLLGNAVKFTQPRKKAIIEVGGWTEEKEVIYFIKDNGVGFDMRYVGKIFGVFQRLHRREEFEGTGVGLAIVQRIINRHGGRVWATAKVGHGAEIYLALPRKGEGIS